MYKQAGKFLSRLNGGSRRRRFNAGLSTSVVMGRQDRHAGWVSQYWRDVIARLDAEAATAIGKKPKAPATTPRPRPPRKATVLDGTRVYLVAFTLRADPSVQFIKVGVSAYDIRARFRPDLTRYEVALLAESQRLTGGDAAMAERAVHLAFRKEHCRPPVRLTSGNTECYAHTERNLRLFVGIVNAI